MSEMSDASARSNASSLKSGVSAKSAAAKGKQGGKAKAKQKSKEKKQASVDSGSMADGSSNSKQHAHFMIQEDSAESTKTEDQDPDDGALLKSRMKSMKAAAGTFYHDMIETDLENQVTDVSPQIGVLWFSAETPDFEKAFAPNDIIMITPLVKLPINDRALFVVERTPKFLKAHKCGSVAAEVESLRFALTETLEGLSNKSSRRSTKRRSAEEMKPWHTGPSSADSAGSAPVLNKPWHTGPLSAQPAESRDEDDVTDAEQNKVVQKTSEPAEDPWFMWPLHDERFNRILLAKLLLCEKGHHVETDWKSIPLDVLKRVARFMGLTNARRTDMLTAIQAHFGSDVALDFLFTYHYISFSWILAAFALIFHILKGKVDPNRYIAYIGPIFQFGILFPWSLTFIVAWRQQVKSVASVWMSDILRNDDKYNNDNLPDFKPWDPDKDPDYYPNWMRAIRTLPMLPLIAFDLFLMMTVLAIVFWAEMYVVFEWGECARINAENQNTECQSADQHKGFLGWLFEATPGLIEGLLFELLLAFSKALARLATWLQNWRTQTEKDLAYMLQLVIFEFIGKFGWIGVLAVVFVPDWSDVGSEKQLRTFRYDEVRCMPPASDNIDSKWFARFDATDNSISCLKSRTQYATRLALFEGAVAAPFWVAQLVSLAIKTIVPSLVVRCRACFTNDHGRMGGCPCKCGRVVLRLLSCMCLLDTGNFRMDDCEYLNKGDLVGQELLDHLSEQQENLEDEQDHVLKQAWKECIREAYQPLDENIETGMHFFWVIAFGAFYPIGILLGVIVFVFDIRTDFYRLTIIQQRNFRKPPEASLIMLFNFMRAAVGFSALFNVGALFVSYQAMSRWYSDPKYDATRGLGNYGWEMLAYIVTISSVLYIIQVIVLHFTHSYDAEHLETSDEGWRKRVSTGSTMSKASKAARQIGEKIYPWRTSKDSTSLLSPIQVDARPVGRPFEKE